MANSGTISKRPILPAASGGPACRSSGTCGTPRRERCDAALPTRSPHAGRPYTRVHPLCRPWRDCTRRSIGDAHMHVRLQLGQIQGPEGGRKGAGRGPEGERRTIGSDAGAAPTVSGAGRADQHVAQFPQFGCRGPFVERGGDILRSASHLIDPVRQVGRVVGRQHHRVGGQSRCSPAVQRGPLLIRPLPARLAAVLAATADRRVGHVPTAPAARLRLGAAGHACRL